MAKIKSVEMSVDEICEDIQNDYEKTLTRRLLGLFIENGYSYLVSATNQKRIYCYIRKSKETLIINKETYADRQADGGFSLQIRITAKKSYEGLDGFSENIRSQILGARECKAPYCCNCGNHYAFEYNKELYKKCHMLCDNYMFSHPQPSDEESIMTIIRNKFTPKRAK